MLFVIGWHVHIPYIAKPRKKKISDHNSSMLYGARIDTGNRRVKKKTAAAVMERCCLMHANTSGWGGREA